MKNSFSRLGLSLLTCSCIFSTSAFAISGTAPDYNINLSNAGSVAYAEGVFGNDAQGDQTKGSVVIMNTNVSTAGNPIVGIYKADTATNGLVWIENSTITTSGGGIYGTNSKSTGGLSANYNTVYLKNVTMNGKGWIAGALADNGVDSVASYNRVTLIDVQICGDGGNCSTTLPSGTDGDIRTRAGHVFGSEPGKTGAFGVGQYNTVDFGGGFVTGIIFGTHPVGAMEATASDPNLTIGNTLNIGVYNPLTGAIAPVTKSMTAGNIANFEFINFYLTSAQEFKNKAEGVLNLWHNQTTNLGANISYIELRDITGLKTSDYIKLLHKTNADANRNITILRSADYVNARVAGLVDFTTSITMENGDKDILMRFNKPMVVTPLPATQVLLSPRVDEMLVLKEGQNSFLGTLDTLVPVERKPIFQFGNVNVFKRYYNEASDSDIRGWVGHIGVGGMGENKWGDHTVGIFIEYGSANYDDDVSAGTFFGGKSKYQGVGGFVKQQNTNGFYGEASLRWGWMENKYDGMIESINRKIDIGGNYWGAHAGLGKLLSFGSKDQTNIYAKFFHTETYKDSTELSGVKINFDKMTSNLLKVGLRESFEFRQNHKLYAGGVYDYEFSGTASGNMQILANKGALKSIETKGGTPAAEVGYVYENKRFKLDITGKKYFGKYKGQSANLRYRIDF